MKKKRKLLQITDEQFSQCLLTKMTKRKLTVTSVWYILKLLGMKMTTVPLKKIKKQLEQ